MILLVAVGLSTRLLDSASFPSLQTSTASVLYDRYGTELARLLPADVSADDSAVLGHEPASLVGLESMAPVFVAAAGAVTQSQNLKVSAPELLTRLWDSLTEQSTQAQMTSSAQPPDKTLAELYVQIVGSGSHPAPLSRPPSVKTRLSAALLTSRVERALSQSELLEFYLNAASYGRGVYGIKNASRAWFGTSIADLNAGQAAFLAAWLAPEATLPPGVAMPVGVGPVDFGRTDFDGSNNGDSEQSVSATLARNAVLFAMYEADAITAAELEDARSQTIDELLRQRSSQLASDQAVLLHIHVAEEASEAGLTEALDAVHEELLDRYGDATVNFGGLHVVTTIDLPYQLTVVDYVTSSSGNASSDNPSSGTAGAVPELIMLDDTGGVRAAVGDVFNAEFTAQNLLGKLSSSQQRTKQRQDTEPAPLADEASVRQAAATFSLLSHAGKLRATHLILSVNTAPPLELVANTGVRPQLLPAVTHTNGSTSEIERHVAELESVFSQTTAEQLFSELMQPFAQISANALGVEQDLPLVARVSTEAVTSAEPAGTDHTSNWIVGWSDRLLIAAHATTGETTTQDTVPRAESDSAPDSAIPDLTTTFSELMQGLHYWPQPSVQP